MLLYDRACFVVCTVTWVSIIGCTSNILGLVVLGNGGDARLTDTCSGIHSIVKLRSEEADVFKTFIKT